MQRQPVDTLERLWAMDKADMLEGYHDGFAGDGEPGDNRSLSYWHGWRNGAVDGKHRMKDAAQARLAHAVLSSGGPRPGKIPAEFSEDDR